MKKSKSIPTPQPATITAEQLAALSGLTRRRLYQLADENRIPQPTDGKFPMLETITALFTWFQRDGADLQREKLLKVTAERQLKELELAKIQGKFLPKEEVGRACAGVGLKIRAVLTRKLCHDFAIRAEEAAPQEHKSIIRCAAAAIGQNAADDALEHLRQELLQLNPKDKP